MLTLDIALPPLASQPYAAALLVAFARRYGEPADGLRDVVDALGGPIVDSRHRDAAAAFVFELCAIDVERLLRPAEAAGELSAAVEAAVWCREFALSAAGRIKADRVIEAARARKN